MNKQDTSKPNVKDISFIKNIKSMAIIGPSKKRNFFFIRSHYKNFRGDIYAIHPTVKKIHGFDDGTKGKIFPSIKDIPNDVDFVFIAVPPSKILDVMDDCVEKGVKLASIFTAEFSDSGTEEGIRLEKELLKHAQNKVRLLGPNGMGLYYPRLGITWRDFPTTPGRIGLIAQSGGGSNIAIYMAMEMGLNFSKVFSFGNGADLDFIDILYYLSNDPETHIILCYVEGIKKNRGKDLIKVLEQNKKPIVFLKGGRSKTGSKAAYTHSASIAGKTNIWKALFNQYNIIEVDSLEQLIYAAKLIESYGVFEINNAAVASISGGYGVILVDLIEKIGINVPPFTPKIQEKLAKTFSTSGTSSKNPLDIASDMYESEIVYNIIDLALSDEKIDGLIIDIPSFYFSIDFHVRADHNFEENIIKALNLGHKHKKPLIFIIERLNFIEDRQRIIKKLNEKNIPVFGELLEFIDLIPKISRCARRMKDR